MNAVEARSMADKANHPDEMGKILKNIEEAAANGEYSIRCVFRYDTMVALQKLGYYVASAESPFTIGWQHV